MRSNVEVSVGDGSCSLIYHDWSGEGALVDLFSIPDCETFKYITLREAMEGNILQEILPEQAQAFMRRQNLHFSAEPDIYIWKPINSGMFTLSSAFELCRQRQN